MVSSMIYSCGLLNGRVYIDIVGEQENLFCGSFNGGIDGEQDDSYKESIEHAENGCSTIIWILLRA